MAGILSRNCGPAIFREIFPSGSRLAGPLARYQLNQVPRMKVSTGMLRLARHS